MLVVVTVKDGVKAAEVGGGGDWFPTEQRVLLTVLHIFMISDDDCEQFKRDETS